MPQNGEHRAVIDLKGEEDSQNGFHEEVNGSIGDSISRKEEEIEELNEDNSQDVHSDDIGDDAGDEDSGDFDDFDDFEDFQEADIVEPSVKQRTHTLQPLQTSAPVKCLSETDFANSVQAQSTVLAILNAYSGDSPTKQASRPFSNHNATDASSTIMSYFSERSLSLWNQLVMVPRQGNPIDWKRSSIRRLLLVSLGVPLDLDEILPKKNSKRLVLPTRGRQPLKSDDSNQRPDEKLQQLINDTEEKIGQWHQLAIVSTEALDGMVESELESHVAGLKAAIDEANGIYEQWVARKQGALKDKETFERVIESLLEYAQRLRK